MILVPLLNPKFAIGLAARVCELRVRGTGVPIPKFATTRGTLSCELRNQRDTSNSMILVPLLNPKFAIALPARLSRTSGSGHYRRTGRIYNGLVPAGQNRAGIPVASRRRGQM